MNDTEIIEKTIEKIDNTAMKLEGIEYGQDSTGMPSVWISFLISSKRKKDVVKNINDFSDMLTDKLFKSGISNWPYIEFHTYK